MKNNFIFLSPRLLSRLVFSEPTNGDYYVRALTNEPPKKALPEEIVRQLLVLSLVHHYRYPEENIRIEFPIQMGRTKKRADVVVLGNSGEVEIIVEAKQFINDDSIAQLKSYVIASGASYGLAVSPLEFRCLKRDGINRLTKVDDIPIFGLGTNEADPFSAPNKAPSAVEQLRGDLNIERFEKIDGSHVRVTIQGKAIKLKNVDLGSYAKFHKRLLASGVVLVGNQVKNSEWLLLIRELLNNTPMAPSEAANDQRRTKELIMSWLSLQQSREGTKIGFVTTLEIHRMALHGKDQDFRSRDARGIASVMRELGWEKCHGRQEGILRNGWRPPIGDSRTTAKKWASML